MTTEEQLLAGMEELAKQIAEIRKVSNQESPKQEIDLTPLNKKLEQMEQNISRIKDSTFSSSSEVSRINGSLNDIRLELRVKLPKEDIHYIEIKKPHHWIIGVAVYFVISLAVIFLLYNSRSNYISELEFAKANDLKYRYLRVKNETLSKYNITNLSTSDVTTVIDNYYKKNPEEIEKFVYQREEDIRRAIEADELARQKEIEAKQAQSEAERLKQKIEPEGN